MALLKRFLISIFLLFLPLVNIFAAAGFVVQKIEVYGLQRISLGTVLSYLPIRQGETLTPEETGSIISTLYSTGFFSDVHLARQGNDLVITVVERPTIGTINFSGNKKIPSKKLKEILNNIGIAEGNVFDRSILEGLQQSLQQQYYSTGNYDAKVTTNVISESRNRVAININIHEGSPAKIKEIKIIGNHAFSQRKLLKNFELTTTRPWSFFTHGDRYSRDKLDADLESLRSYYLDRGYLRFKVNSYDAALSPDKKSVHITINVTEGPVYHISGYALSGNLLGHEEEVRKLIALKPGEVFSRRKIMDIDSAISYFYGTQGYAFANVEPMPKIDDASREVFLTFKIEPGQRVYVRRITFTGNTKTQDVVLRREMRQQEGGLYSVANIEESKRRLSNIGFLQNVQVKTEPVPGQPNQVDIDYGVTEMSSATASIQAGYSDAYGLLYGANVTESNLLGTGRQLGLSFENNQYSNIYSLNYMNPYYTEAGMNRGFTIFSQRVTPGRENIAPYTSNIEGAKVAYGMPISEYSGVGFGYGYQNISISPGANPAVQIANFVHQHGESFNQVSLNGTWQRTTYDRALLPTQGTRQSFGVEVGVPVMAKPLEYYQLVYQAGWYHPLPKEFILHLNGALQYANGFGAYNNALPFFKNFFAGGIGSVRAYQQNVLGPRDNWNNPIGGNVLTTGSFSLIVPNHISEKLRTSIFVDAGNVFENQLALNRLRYSTGIGVQLYIPMIGPLEMSLGLPLNRGKNDVSEPFQFSVATSF